MNELALFAGAGGGILGGKLLGWRTVCAVEYDAYAASVLCARQNDGFLTAFPIWDDVRTFDGRPWRGIVDVVSGGFPCQDISAAGKGAGLDGERSGLWVEMARIIGEVRPSYAFVENSPMLTARGLGRVLGDLAEMGFDARWGVLSATDVGAPHLRERIWIVAADARRALLEVGTERERNGRSGDVEQHACGALADARRASRQRRTDEQTTSDREATERHEAADHAEQCREVAIVSDAARVGRQEEELAIEGPASFGAWCRFFARANQAGGWQWQPEPDVGRVADGVAFRVDRLKCLGNGQVPLCAAEAWRILTTT